MNEKQEAKFIRMTTAPVGKLIGTLAVPTIISMMVTAAYNMADTFFVGMLKSNSATGAVGVVFSLMAIIQALGFFFGHGSGNFISMELGRQNTDKAAKMAATGVVYSFLAGTVLLILGEIFLEPLARLLGSTETILPYAKDYLRIILIGAPYMTASFVLNNQLRFQGSAAYGMVGIVVGAVLNVGLDPLFIFTFGMGIAGAAWATILSQLASFCLLLVGCSRGGNLPVRLKNAQFKLSWLGMICKGGFPSLCRQGLMSVATICLNHAAGVYGDYAIAAMSVVQRAMMMINSALIGFGQGFQPVCGFNYGAKLYDRVRKGYWFCVRWGTLALLVMGGAMFAFAPQVIAIFRDDPDVVAFGTLALRCQCCTLVLNCFNMISSMMTQTLNRVVPASILAVARSGLFLIPTILIAPRFLDAFGLQAAQSVADVCSFLLTIPLTIPLLRELSSGEKAG